MMAVILHDRVYVVLPDGAESGAIRAVSAGLRRLLRPASPPPAPPTSQASHHPADESGGGNAGRSRRPVSYTHLTLPTICSV